MWDEVDPDYAAVYPYNDSKQSESGHYFDIDDTRQKERICMMHRTGTMQEMRSTGSIHRKDMHHAIQLVHGTDFKNVRGNLWHTTERYTRFRSKGKTIIEVNADMEVGVANDYTMVVGQPDENKGTFQVHSVIMNLYAKEELRIFCPKILISGEVAFQCPVSAPVFSGNFKGNLYGIAEQAVVANMGEAPTKMPELLGGVICKEPTSYTPVPVVGGDEAPIDEVITSCRESSQDEEDAAKDSFEDKMRAWFARIMAPTGSAGSGGGGAGQDWVYWMPDGTMGGFHSHHATGDAEILEYLWCLGAVSAQLTECSTGQVSNFSRPAGFVCPIPGGPS